MIVPATGAVGANQSAIDKGNLIEQVLYDSLHIERCSFCVLKESDPGMVIIHDKL